MCSVAGFDCSITDWGDVAALATALGISSIGGGAIAFLVTYHSGQRADRERAERATYDATDERYLEFQRLALEYSELDVAEIPMSPTPILAPELEHKRLNLYLLLIATFERAFVMYTQRSKSVRLDQWTPWQAYIGRYLDRPGFKEAYTASRGTWVVSFDKYMCERLGIL